MFRRLILWLGETNLIGQVFLVGSLGSYGDRRGTLLGPLFRSNVWKFLSVQVLFLKPKGGLDIFTYKDQQSVFLGFQFRKSISFWEVVRTVALEGFQTNAVFLSALHLDSIF